MDERENAAPLRCKDGHLKVAPAVSSYSGIEGPEDKGELLEGPYVTTLTRMLNAKPYTGSLFYLTATVCHYSPLLCANGRSEWPMTI